MKYSYIVRLVFICLGCANETKVKEHTLQGNAFGTTYSLIYFSSSEKDVEAGIDSVLNAVNQSVSTYLPESDISKINAGDSTVVIDAIFKDVYLLSKEINKNTYGYFDPTVGVLRNAYGFGDTKPLTTINTTTLDSLMQYVGLFKTRLTENNTIYKEHPEIYLDFNAIAKGYGIDCIGAYLKQIGCSNYLLELGGEILTRGSNLTKNTPWRVGVESVKSDLDDRTVSEIITLTDKAMASSGNYRKFRVDSLSGKKYVHTLNPLSGSAEKSNITSATVIAKNCALADAYATSFMALGLKKSLMVLQKQPDLEVYFTYIDSKGQEDIYMSNGFKAIRVPN